MDLKSVLILNKEKGGHLLINKKCLLWTFVFLYNSTVCCMCYFYLLFFKNMQYFFYYSQTLDQSQIFCPSLS